MDGEKQKVKIWGTHSSKIILCFALLIINLVV